MLDGNRAGQPATIPDMKTLDRRNFLYLLMATAGTTGMLGLHQSQLLESLSHPVAPEPASPPPELPIRPAGGKVARQPGGKVARQPVNYQAGGKVARQPANRQAGGKVARQPGSR